jgi:hypothetical protein
VPFHSFYPTAGEEVSAGEKLNWELLHEAAGMSV